MVTKEKIESYLLDLSLDYEEQGEGLWLVSGEERGLERLVIMLAEPVVIVQIKVMKVPEGRQAELYEQLLRLNASDLIFGAYALQDEDVILINTLQAETLDLEELRGTIDGIGLALSQHYELLSRYRS
jgi:hypothetical protein